MEKTNWHQSETGSYFSYHITVTYSGEKEPKYHVLEMPDGWVIGVFYGFVGEYVPLEEEHEERLFFSTSEEAKDYIDKVLEQIG
ncbi:hypothetical protein ACFWGC_23820 [Cytobacillus pseudoceanisediminis]|uniref:hypothetical protein n=1 Tax=Cytobacillus pseudoceanisediminis TaxID=3051614 RepID=UPI0036636D7A